MGEGLEGISKTGQPGRRWGLRRLESPCPVHIWALEQQQESSNGVRCLQDTGNPEESADLDELVHRFRHSGRRLFRRAFLYGYVGSPAGQCIVVPCRHLSFNVVKTMV